MAVKSLSVLRLIFRDEIDEYLHTKRVKLLKRRLKWILEHIRFSLSLMYRGGSPPMFDNVLQEFRHALVTFTAFTI